MALLDALYKKEGSETVALIDIASDSVAGAYVRYSSKAPFLIYTRRLPIERHRDEEPGQAMLRAFGVLGEAMVREGAPSAMRATGSGRADEVIVSIDAPWQETMVRTELIERSMPFVFTKSIVSTVLERTRSSVAGKQLANESIIGTSLNGYETRAPYGKRARRASLLVLTSYIDEDIGGKIIDQCRRLYHTRKVGVVASCSLRYQAMRAAFPHEADALVLDVSRTTISVVLIRNGFFIAVADVPRPPHGKWVPPTLVQLAELAKQYPLPRTIFLIAPPEEAGMFRKALDEAQLGSLWLSDNPPTLVTVLASHLVGLVDLSADAVPDLSLLLMALYGNHQTLL